MADIAGTRAREVDGDDGVEELEAKRRRSLSQQKESADLGSGSSISSSLPPGEQVAGDEQNTKPCV